LFLRIVPGLLKADESLDYQAEDLMFKYWDVPDGQRAILHDKCLACLQGYQEILEREKAKHAR